MNQRMLVVACVALYLGSLAAPSNAAGLAAGPQETVKKSDGLSCTPQQPSGKSTLVLRFGAGHPDELGILGPDGTWFFLVYRDDGIHPGLRPLVSKSVFARQQELTLRTATAEGSPWVDRRNRNERILVKPGRYRVVVMAALKSDAQGIPRSECSVQYEP